MSNEATQAVNGVVDKLCTYMRLSHSGKWASQFRELVTGLYSAALEEAAQLCESEGARDACAVAEQIRASKVKQ